jgi:hypothetical protein
MYIYIIFSSFTGCFTTSHQVFQQISSMHRTRKYHFDDLKYKKEDMYIIFFFCGLFSTTRSIIRGLRMMSAREEETLSSEQCKLTWMGLLCCWVEGMGSILPVALMGP